MKCKCVQCGKVTKNIPRHNIDKKAPTGWYWSSKGLVCNKCYEKIKESLVSKNENPTLAIRDNGVWS